MPIVDELRTWARDLLSGLIPTQRGPFYEAAVRADDDLVEALRAGCAPRCDDPLVRLLVAWRAQALRALPQQSRRPRRHLLPQ